MQTLIPLLWLAGGVQLAIAAVNFALPRKLHPLSTYQRWQPRAWLYVDALRLRSMPAANGRLSGRA